MAVRKREDEVFPNAAGIDVGGSSHWVAVPARSSPEPVREFGAMTDDLNAMATWLIASGVDTVALESTGVYWIRVFEVLEQRGLNVWLVDARQMKYVPGRKSDVQDCQWLQKLMSLGFLRAAFRPDVEVCELRAVARQRDILVAEQASWVQRMQKALVQMNIQLTEVLSDVMGRTGELIIRSIVAGERDPKALARHRDSRVKASTEEIIKALTGNWREEHLFVLRQSLGMYDDIARHLADCDTKLNAGLKNLGQKSIDLGKTPRAGSKQRKGYDMRQVLANWAGVDLTRINGLGLAAVTKILTEIGPDLSRFPTVKHFCSWLGLCPGTKISGGKVLSAKTKRSVNRVRQALKVAAMSLSHCDSALGAFYRRLCARMDKPSANTAVAHKLARMVYFMMTRGEVLVSEYASGPVSQSGRPEKSTNKAGYKEAADFFTKQRKFCLLSGRHPYKYAWIAKHKTQWPVTLTCEVLEVSASGYFEHWRRKDTTTPSKPGVSKRISDEALLVHIKAIHAEVKQEYGWPKMWKELVARGIRVGKERVDQLMQRHGIKARGKRKFVVTTDSKHNLPIALNLLERNFSPEAPNQVWTSDITYIATDEGWLYLTGVIDLFSRQVVGWSMRDNMQTNAVTDALRMAWFRRRPEPGLIFRSDGGSQYCSHEFQSELKRFEMKSSMSRKGNCWDNAPTESLWGRLKVGRLYGRRFATRREAMDEVIDWLNFYNHKRLHSTLGYVSPMTFEQRWTAAQQQGRKSA